MSDCQHRTLERVSHCPDCGVIGPDLDVFDDRDDREPIGECRICGDTLRAPSNCTCQCPYCSADAMSMDYNSHSPRDCHIGNEEELDLCFPCWVRRDKAEAEYIAILTHGGARHA